MADTPTYRPLRGPMVNAITGAIYNGSNTYVPVAVYEQLERLYITLSHQRERGLKEHDQLEEEMERDQSRP